MGGVEGATLFLQNSPPQTDLLLHFFHFCVDSLFASCLLPTLWCRQVDSFSWRWCRELPFFPPSPLTPSPFSIFLGPPLKVHSHSTHWSRHSHCLTHLPFDFLLAMPPISFSNLLLSLSHYLLPDPFFSCTRLGSPPFTVVLIFSIWSLHHLCGYLYCVIPFPIFRVVWFPQCFMECWHGNGGCHQFAVLGSGSFRGRMGKFFFLLFVYFPLFLFSFHLQVLFPPVMSLFIHDQLVKPTGMFPLHDPPSIKYFRTCPLFSFFADILPSFSHNPPFHQRVFYLVTLWQDMRICAHSLPKLSSLYISDIPLLSPYPIVSPSLASPLFPTPKVHTAQLHSAVCILQLLSAAYTFLHDGETWLGSSCTPTLMVWDLFFSSLFWSLFPFQDLLSNVTTSFPLCCYETRVCVPVIGYL